MLHELGLGGLGKHEHRAAGGSVERVARFVPKIYGHAACHVAAEAVDTGFTKPEAEGVDHGATHLGIRVIELVYVRPVERTVHFTLLIECEEIGVFLHPGVVAAGVVGHPVDYHLHAGGMGGVDHGAEIVHDTEFGVYALIVGHGIVAAELALAVELRYGGYGHEPEYVHAKLFETGELCLKGLESAFGGVLTGIHLVDYRVAAPFGVRERSMCGLLCGRAGSESKESGESRHKAFQHGKNR